MQGPAGSAWPAARTPGAAALSAGPLPSKTGPAFRQAGTRDSDEAWAGRRHGGLDAGADKRSGSSAGGRMGNYWAVTTCRSSASPAQHLSLSQPAALAAAAIVV